ncbi:hypothetical protein [Streptomyces sp. NPDC059072]|uniref:hypothetical protein n=1 Tax=Streptomyces sp. NPDC059072 TaxID=3346715 RepID=UPI00368ECCB7
MRGLALASKIVVAGLAGAFLTMSAVRAEPPRPASDHDAAPPSTEASASPSAQASAQASASPSGRPSASPTVRPSTSPSGSKRP